MRDTWEKRFDTIRELGWVALGGLVVLACALLPMEAFAHVALILGTVLLFPFLIYVYVIVIWHWKERYRGAHSDLWGFLIVVETTGWMKAIYFLRHLLPDMRGTGDYRRESPPDRQL